jgi:membrane protein
MGGTTRIMTASSRRFWSAMNLGGLTLHEAAARTWTRIIDNAIMTRAAAITFYAIAALVPFMALIIAMTARWLPRLSDETATDLLVPFSELLPGDAAAFISGELARLRTQPATGFVSFGLIALVWLSSSVFVEMMDAMNFILGVRETRPFWKRRAIAIAMTLSQAAILIGAVSTVIAWPQILKFLHLRLSGSNEATIIHQITVFLAVLGSFALALYIAPDADQNWEWISPGSLCGTTVLLAVSILFRIYAQYWGNYSATYGSLAGIVVLMSWLWLSTLVLLTAAELNKVIKDASPVNKVSEISHGHARENIKP